MTARLAYSDDPQVYGLRDAVADAMDDPLRVADAFRSIYSPEWDEASDDMAAMFVLCRDKLPAAFVQRVADAMANRWDAYNEEQEN